MSEHYTRIESILLRCWITGLAVLVVWFLAILLLSDQILGIHGSLFGLTRHELDLIMYCGMGLWKLGVILFFFIPWLSFRTTRQSKS